MKAHFPPRDLFKDMATISLLSMQIISVDCAAGIHIMSTTYMYSSYDFSFLCAIDISQRRQFAKRRRRHVRRAIRVHGRRELARVSASGRRGCKAARGIFFMYPSFTTMQKATAFCMLSIVKLGYKKKKRIESGACDDDKHDCFVYYWSQFYMQLLLLPNQLLSPIQWLHRGQTPHFLQHQKAFPSFLLNTFQNSQIFPFNMWKM